MMKRLLLAASLLLMAAGPPQVVPPSVITGGVGGETFKSTGGTAARTLADRAADRLNLKDFGALGNTKTTRATVSITSGAASLTAASGVFAATDVGKTILVPGAGASGATLSTTIAAYISATAVTLAANASTTLAAAGPSATAPATVIWGADDTAALTAAVSASNTKMATGVLACIYVPAGNYLVASAPGAFAQGLPGCVVGDGPSRSAFYLTPGFAGDLFAWSEAWITTTSGPYVANIRVNGSSAATGQQNALMFYDRIDNLAMENVDIWNVPGRAILSGVTKNTTQSYIRESHFRSVRVQTSGTASIAPVEFNSQGSTGTDGTNEIAVDQMEVYGSVGPSMIIRNNSAGAVRNMKFVALRIEGTEFASSTGDLLQIGDAVMTGGVNNLRFTDLELIDPYPSYAAMRVTAAAAASMPYALDVRGFIGGGFPAGKGLVLAAGRNMKFEFTGISTTDTNVTVGATPLTGGGIEIVGPGGSESGWTWSVDSSAYTGLFSRPMRFGNPGSPGTFAFTLNNHDGTAGGGNPIPSGSIDMQTSRNSATQIASGGSAILLGGAFNSVPGGTAAVLGGSTNTAAGPGAFIAGSTNAYDRGRPNSWTHSSGAVNGFNAGSAQAASQVLYTSGTAAMRLTAQNSAAGSTNIVNIPNNAVYNLSIRLSAIDRTAPANGYVWTLPLAILTRQAAVSTTAIALGTPVSMSLGTGSTAAVSLTADTTNAGINLTFTPPSGTDTWDVAAEVITTEVQ